MKKIFLVIPLLFLTACASTEASAETGTIAYIDKLVTNAYGGKKTIEVDVENYFVSRDQVVIYAADGRKFTTDIDNVLIIEEGE